LILRISCNTTAKKLHLSLVGGKKKVEPQKAYIPYDIHFNEYGHQIAAKALLE
jgi:hypothetical protein